MDVVQKVLELSGFSELNPAQQAAIDSGLLEEGNFVVASPTASGKTLLAEIASLETIKKGKKVIYIVPLRALATEKYDEFKEKYESMGIKVGISIGDLDNSDPWLTQYDIVIVTSEKLDSLLRHGASWISLVGLVVVDEIHLLDSANRGPTLEIVLTRLRQICDPKILGLSATIKNYQDLASWLNAKSVKTDYRPVKLYKGLCFDRKVEFFPEGSMELNSSFTDVANLVYDTLDKQKQALFFVSTRKSSESAAEQIGKLIKERVWSTELEEFGKKVESVLERPTDQCKRLGAYVRMGSAFHHAGLTNKQRKLVEDGFKKGLIKFISATPTLAAGLNLPAYRVIIRDLKRFYSYKGMDFLPNLEIEQMSGRAGRPKYDNKGEAILIPKNNGEYEYAWHNYIHGETENIYSKLGVEPVLRTHVLALIASGVVATEKQMIDFFEKTFYAYQYKDLDQLKVKIDNVIQMLEKFGLVKQIGSSGDFVQANQMGERSFQPTPIGKRVSELYIDPLTANFLINSLGKELNTFGILQFLCNCIEMKPLLSVKKKDEDMIEEIILREKIEMPDHESLEFEDYMSSIKTASVFLSWIEEKGEDNILEIFGVTPGELKARLDIMDWLLYSTQELCLLLNNMDNMKKVKKVRVRMKYGAREELLPLVRLKGIGRVKARTLFNFGLKDVGDLKKIPLESLSRLVGYKTAEKIRDQL